MRAAAIVYSEATGIPRKIRLASRMEELAGAYRPGEGIIILPPEQIMQDGLPDDDAVQALIEAKRGKPSEPYRCIVIDDANAEIVGILPADPTLDAIDGKTLYQHPEAVPGWGVDESGAFVAPAPEEEEGEDEAAEGEPQ